MKIEALDHLVLTVADITASIAFYRDVLGMKAEAFTPVDGPKRWALKFGKQKINLHQAGAEFEPKAANATPGSADLCFISAQPLADWQAHFAAIGVGPVLGGPCLKVVPRTGATGGLTSLYLRDPDGNLIEVSNIVG